MLCRFRRSALRTVVCFSLMTLACEPLLKAQISTSTIDGRVEDPSGAVITGAAVVLTNASNGYKQVSASNGDGLFSFSALPAGVYTLAASASGFRAAQVTNVNATVGETTAVTVKMEVGGVNQQVQVTADVDVLNTSDSSISSVVGGIMVDNLPTLRRNFTDFALLNPSVTVDGQFGSISFAGALGDVNSNYANANASNAFSVDGANATSRYLGEQRGQTRIPYLFGSEAVQEFQIAENPYSPAYGGAVTGYVNTVTKSGTNTFHGDAFYYNRNTGTGAIDAVSKANGYPKALDVRQQFGAGRRRTHQKRQTLLSVRLRAAAPQRSYFRDQSGRVSRQCDEFRSPRGHRTPRSDGISRAVQSHSSGPGKSALSAAGFKRAL